MTETDPIIFIASTCYDLADIRSELRADLEKDGFIVRLSEDWDSDFRVDPQANSIQSCLKNIETSDTALFIFDRRYGPPILGDKRNRSATHIEYEHAREKGIDSLYFVRDRTWDQLNLWSSNRKGYKRRYVPESRYENLFSLIAEIRELNLKDPKNNWVETFKHSLEFRRIARQMLYKLHPAYAGARAKTRERIVRVTFDNVTVHWSRDRASVSIGSLRNAGLNVAEGVELFLMDGAQRVIEAYGVARYYFEVLGVEEAKKDIQFSIPVRNAGGKPGYEYQDLRIVCEYKNLWQDKYRVWAPLEQTNSNPPYLKGREKLEVRMED